MSYYWRTHSLFPFSAANSVAEKPLTESDEAVGEFNEQFLLNSSANIDISRYASATARLLAGTYRVK